MHSLFSEQYLGIKSYLQVVTPHSAHVLYNHCADFALFHIFNQTFPVRAVKTRPALTVISIVGEVGVTVFFRIVL